MNIKKNMSIQILNDIIELIEVKYGNENFVVYKKITEHAKYADFSFGGNSKISYRFIITRHDFNDI